MVCPGCGHDNIQGEYDCEQCGLDLAGYDQPETRAGEGLGRHLLTDSVRQVGPLRPLMAAASASIWDAIRMMREGKQGSVLVVDHDDGDRVLGIFTERDVLTRVWGSGLDLEATPVSAVMTPDPIAVREDHSVAHAIHLMAMRGFRHIPVVREGRAVGFVSVRGILRYISDRVSSGA
jgi:CBS domain-containing protein